MSLNPMRILTVVLFFSALLFATERAGLCEDDLRDRPQALGLQELIDLAVSRSPEVGESRSEQEMAKADLDQVKGAYYPQVESTAVVGPVQDADLPVIRNDKIYDPSPGLSFETIGVFGRLDFAVTQPLYTFGKLSTREQAAIRGIRAKAFQSLQTKNEVALRVAELYYALVFARGGGEASQEARDFFEEVRRRVKRLLELKAESVAETDLYRIDAYISDTYRSSAEAEKGERIARFGLRSLTGLPPDFQIKAPPDVFSPTKEELQDLNHYIEEAFQTRPEFKQLEEALEAQKFQVEAARSDRYPSFFLALIGSFAGAPGREELDNPYIEDDYNHVDVGFVAGAKWEFNFWTSKAKIDRALAEYRKLRFSKGAAEQNIPIQIAKHYEEILEWRESAKAYGQGALSSRRWVVASLADFGMGVGRVDDMLRAIEKYGHNQGQFLESLFNYKVSLADLKYAVGTLAFQETGPRASDETDTRKAPNR